MSKSTTDEAALAAIADTAVETSEKEEKKGVIVSGRPLPKDVINPEIGQIGHYCLDPQGRYQEDWMQLKIRRDDENMPSRHFFANGSQEWRISTGIWVDVPPGLLAALDRAEVENIEMDITKANPILDDSVKKVINRIPRFGYNILPSV